MEGERVEGVRYAGEVDPLGQPSVRRCDGKRWWPLYGDARWVVGWDGLFDWRGDGPRVHGLALSILADACAAVGLAWLYVPDFVPELQRRATATGFDLSKDAVVDWIIATAQRDLDSRERSIAGDQGQWVQLGPARCRTSSASRSAPATNGTSSAAPKKGGNDVV